MVGLDSCTPVLLLIEFISPPWLIQEILVKPTRSMQKEEGIHWESRISWGLPCLQPGKAPLHSHSSDCKAFVDITCIEPDPNEPTPPHPHSSPTTAVTNGGPGSLWGAGAVWRARLRSHRRKRPLRAQLLAIDKGRQGKKKREEAVTLKRSRRAGAMALGLPSSLSPPPSRRPSVSR